MKNKKKMFIFIILIISIVIIFMTVNVVPPQSITCTRMDIIKTRIVKYVIKNNKLPTSLKDLDKLKDYDNSIKDAWGKDIHYIIEDVDTVILKSLGINNKQGGNKDSQDIIGKFKLNNDKNIIDEEIEWLIDPYDLMNKAYKP